MVRFLLQIEKIPELGTNLLFFGPNSVCIVGVRTVEENGGDCRHFNVSECRECDGLML